MGLLNIMTPLHTRLDSRKASSRRRVFTSDSKNGRISDTTRKNSITIILKITGKILNL